MIIIKKMSNITTRPLSKKTEMIFEEMNDFSANITSKILAEATQNISVVQEQNLVIKNSVFINCNVTLQQQAEVTAKQIAVFKVFLSNPRQVLKKLTQGPNSLLGQMFNSTSPVMNEFLDTARSNYGVSTNAELKQRMTNIMKMNISQTAIAKATQNIMVNQKQNVLLDNIQCTGGQINIKQEAVVNAVQNVMVQIAMNSLSSDPKFRQTIRQFNGDYNKDLLNEEIDAGVQIPEVCMNDLKTTARQPVCSECESCPICPVPEPCNLNCPQCSDYVLNASLFYGVIGVFLFLLLIAIILK
jgi:hypothetical protein